MTDTDQDREFYEWLQETNQKITKAVSNLFDSLIDNEDEVIKNEERKETYRQFVNKKCGGQIR